MAKAAPIALSSYWNRMKKEKVEETFGLIIYAFP